MANGTDLSFFDKHAQGVGFAYKMNVVALMSLFCTGSGVDAEGPKQQDRWGSAGHIALMPAGFLH